ncbi:cGMP-specific 3',5'-cyclic phosphodiesterase-like isoform X3 [Apostichopus japonicus]|uniref:cGMP-specific 3',5'-cyclic phosphodiesterase-like isoform X3 n=1 Tax=Stichopus japonicus TaxID=307972 RepID=UPI003AB1C5B7
MAEKRKNSPTQHITREDVVQYLKDHHSFTEDYFIQYATSEMVDGWITRHSSSRHSITPAEVASWSDGMPHDSKGPHVLHNIRKSFAGASGSLKSLLSPNRKKKTLRKNKSVLKQLDEKDLFMELIRDIADELDLNTLSHKILMNVSILTNGDRCSLFLVRGTKENRYLCSRLFDVTENSTVEDVLHSERDEIRIPFGQGIAGHVAKYKESINIKNAYEDPRFNPQVDKRTGYTTHSILCMPICNHDGDVVGVAQVINKVTGAHEFTNKDEEVFRNYLTFCGIGIMNAQLFEMSVTEYKRNQMLLGLARGIFEEQTSLDKMVYKIMVEALTLLRCERCMVFILHDDEKLSIPSQLRLSRGPGMSREMSTVSNVSTPPPSDIEKEISFSTAFDLTAKEKEKVEHLSPDALQKSVNSEIAKHVASTGETINMNDFESQNRFVINGEVDKENQIHSILCQPIYNSERKVIGVAQMINRTTDDHLFTEQDENLFEAFAIFCGLGIHNTQMYENAIRLMAKQQVALEVLSYHATAQKEEVEKMKGKPIATAEAFKLNSFSFSDFNLTEDETVQASIRMFMDLDLVDKFHIPYKVLCRWLLSVRKNYRPVIYHNWRHAFNVAQTMFSLIKVGGIQPLLHPLEMLGLLVACLCHDLDHRGTNNTFQTKTASPLALLYSTSTMEHHHFDHSIMILNSEGNNIFQALSPEEYREVIQVLESAILSTDLAIYFKKRNNFFKLIEQGERQFQKNEEKDLLRGMMMTACDVSAIAKPWEIQRDVAELVFSEFFEQGDMERQQLQEEPIAMMDRKKKDELPKMQVGFIDAICMPVYKNFAEMNPGMRPLLDGVSRNRVEWELLATEWARGSSTSLQTPKNSVKKGFIHKIWYVVMFSVCSAIFIIVKIFVICFFLNLG